MQAGIRNVGAWEMKCIRTALVPSWKRAALDLGDGCHVFEPTENSPKMASRKGESHEYSTHCSPETGTQT